MDDGPKHDRAITRIELAMRRTDRASSIAIWLGAAAGGGVALLIYALTNYGFLAGVAYCTVMSGVSGWVSRRLSAGPLP